MKTQPRETPLLVYQLQKRTGVGWWYCMEALEKGNYDYQLALYELSKTRSFIKVNKC